MKCVARNCDGCVKFVLKLCYRQHILTDCNKCKRLSARAIDYMRRVHCSDGTAGDRGAGQRPLMVLLSQLQLLRNSQLRIHKSETQIGKCWLIHSIDNSLQNRSYQCYSQLKCQCNSKPQFPILRFDAPFHFAHKFLSERRKCSSFSRNIVMT